MAKIDDIYNAVDDFGLITSAEARDLGVSNAELVQQARRGKLNRVGRGVYRMPIWPYQEASPYAIAVKTVGPNAYLYGESVIALLELVPTNPSRITIATPNRVRKDLKREVQIITLPAKDSTTYYEGVPSQFVYDALKSAANSIGSTRTLQAADAALKLGYITKQENEALREELIL
ncbi:MAG: hypothetical protein RR186_06850 [Raoultibacter sp.]